MFNTRMLYKSPGPQRHQDGTFEYLIVEEQDTSQYIKKGWFLTTAEALLAANESTKNLVKGKGAK